MKRIALFIILFLVFGFITSIQELSLKSEKAVFADNAGGNGSLSNKSKSLKLMTYNIHRGIGKNGKLNLTSTADVIQEAKPDIVALQEVERFSPRTGFSDEIGYLSSSLGMNYAYGKSLNILMGQYGNALLSRYPIEEYSTIKLPSMKEQRTVLRAVINVEGNNLAVYDVHLGLSQTERKEQIDYIIQLLAAEKLNYVLIGDMNSTADKLSSVTDIMKDSAEGSKMAAQGTIEDNSIWKRIDYIFLSKNIKAAGYNVIPSEASDHYPVVSEIVISN